MSFINDITKGIDWVTENQKSIKSNVDDTVNILKETGLINDKDLNINDEDVNNLKKSAFDLFSIFKSDYINYQVKNNWIYLAGGGLLIFILWRLK